MMESRMLIGKKVLFIAPQFHSYEKKIIKTLINYGAVVDYYDERPDNTFLTKSLIRINRKLIFLKTNKYYDSILNICKNKDYDYIFFIRGEAISRNRIIKFRKKFINSKMILYLWDSVSYNPNCLKIYDIFDCVFSFDSEDCKNYKFKFEPLFFDDEYFKSSFSVKNKKYDVSFIGTVHTDRISILLKLEKEFQEKGLSYFFYLYYPSIILFFIRKIFCKNFRIIENDKIKFVPIDYEKMCSVVSSSNAVIDINRPKQDGLTIRTLEVLGSGTKLITTNSEIKNNSIYNENIINIIDRVNPSIDRSFFKNEYLENFVDNLGSHRISRWILRVFSA